MDDNRGPQPDRDLERGPDVELERIAEQHSEGGAAARGMDASFGESTKELWILYGDVAKRYDDDRIRALKEDMDGIPVYAGLLSAVIAGFVLPKFQDLQVNPAQQAVYYQQQSTQMLAQISQQIASIGTQVPLNVTPISPYPTFHPSVLDRLVTILWLLSLMCSLSAALLSALVQQWVRVYMRVYQRSSSPLKKARTRQYFFEGVQSLPAVAEAAPGLVHISLILFLLGLGIAVLKTDIVVGITTVVPIGCCGYIYLCSVIASNPQSPYHNPFSQLILLVIQNLHRGSSRDGPRSRGVWPARMEARQKMPEMGEKTELQALDMLAVQWLAEHIDGENEKEAFVLATSGIFKQEWGRELWHALSTQKDFQPDASGTQLTPPPKGTTVGDLCGHVRDVFEIHHSEGDPIAQRRRMRGCIETMASLVCCAGVQFSWFGEVGEVLSYLGPTDGINKSSTIRSASDASFIVPWTCLSLVAIRHMVRVKGNKIRELAVSAVDGIARIPWQLDHVDGSSELDDSERACKDAKMIDRLLTTAWGCIEGLYRAFNPWDQNSSGEEIRNTLRVKGCEVHISELERIGNEANGMDDVDLRISLLQDTMDEATHKLMQQLPGVSFDEFKPSGPISISDAFKFPIFGSTPITPQFILPGQRLQILSALGREFRDIIENRSPEQLLPAKIEHMKSVDQIPIPTRQPKDLMIRQVWRLQDLRDGEGLGFTIELFFHALRELSSTSSSPEFERAFYVGTFNVVTSGWENSKNVSGTQRILLNLICDLVIKNRGVYSDFRYPAYVVDMLLELVGKMVVRHGNAHPHCDDAVRELWMVKPPRKMDRGLRDKALLVLGHSTAIPSPDV